MLLGYRTLSVLPVTGRADKLYYMKGRAQSVCVRPYVFTSHLSPLTSHLSPLKKARDPCNSLCPVRSEPPSEWISPSESPSSMSPSSSFFPFFFHFFIITFFHSLTSHLSPSHFLTFLTFKGVALKGSSLTLRHQDLWCRGHWCRRPAMDCWSFPP